MPEAAHTIIAQLRARASRRMLAAQKQPARHAEYAASCVQDAEFYRRVIDCIETMLAREIEARVAALPRPQHLRGDGPGGGAFPPLGHRKKGTP